MFNSRVRSSAASEEAALLINMIGQVGAKGQCRAREEIRLNANLSFFSPRQPPLSLALLLSLTHTYAPPPPLSQCLSFHCSSLSLSLFSIIPLNAWLFLLTLIVFSHENHSFPRASRSASVKSRKSSCAVSSSIMTNRQAQTTAKTPHSNA